MNLKQKIIKGNPYWYLCKSIKLPNGKVKVIEKFLKNKRYNKKEAEKFFIEKEKGVMKNYAIKAYGIDSIFTEEQIEKIEAYKTDYKYLIKEIPKASLKDLFNRFTANFTYESNALEGNSLTLKDVAIVMFENASIKSKDLREIYETRNSRKVVELILNKKIDFSHEDIVKMHKLLVKDMDIQPGYKKLPNELIGRRIKTTPPEKVHGEMNKLIECYQKEKEKTHPIKLAAIIHGRFEKIHPFQDGNGRVGRFLINVILVNNNYPPLIIRKSQRIAYLKALENFDYKHEETLARFILKRYKETYRKFFEVYLKYL